MTLLSRASISISLKLYLHVASIIYEIFSVKEWRDLETWGRGHSRSLKMETYMIDHRPIRLSSGRPL